MPGSLYNLSLTTKEKTVLFESVGNLDGVEALGLELQGFVLTDWVKGTVLVTSKNPPEVVIEGLQGSADIAYPEKEKLLIVPEMNTNKLHAFKLEKK